MAPETALHSERPLFGRISAIRWYDQYYWTLALDQSPAGQAGGYYDLLRVDRNRDGDMTDEGEVVPGRLGEEGDLLTFPVGDLYFLDKKSPDQRFLATDLLVTAQANGDPAIRMQVHWLHRMFGEHEYQLVAPYGGEMRFSPNVTRMPTLNMVPEIVAAPEFKGKETQLVIKDGDHRFRIGEDHRLSLVCLTGHPGKNDYVFALRNSSFKKPVLATLTFHSQAGGVEEVEYQLEEWSDELTFSGTISIPDEALPGPATLVVNFSEVDEASGLPAHFTQVARNGWRLDVMLYR